jgi:hypothetical protein
MRACRRGSSSDVSSMRADNDLFTTHIETVLSEIARFVVV